MIFVKENPDRKQNNKKKLILVYEMYSAGTQRPEDVPLWSYFSQNVPEHNRTKIIRINF